MIAVMTRAPRNRTLSCTATEQKQYVKTFLTVNHPVTKKHLRNRIINQDYFAVIPHLPESFVDLVILDPPYNLTKNYNGHLFREKQAATYSVWFTKMLAALLPTLKPHATVYVCSDWKTSNLIFPILDQSLHVRNRITWQRDKGRGSKSNWKNNTEDIWFCTVGKEYCFNVEAVKLRKRVVAPYRTADGQPKDWREEENGNFRLTHPSNLWPDITIPFWSMPENTDHPTQKPEKLIARLMLASSNEGDFVFDPFMGSGTTAAVAKKLSRDFCGVEMNREYCCWAAKRLKRAEADTAIQGYRDGCFVERNA